MTIDFTNDPSFRPAHLAADGTKLYEPTTNLVLYTYASDTQYHISRYVAASAMENYCKCGITPELLTTILDAHFVQLIICGIMIWLGTGPIKGFGVTLLIGVVSTLFSVLITGHLLMELLVESETLKKMTMRRMLKDLNVDFVKYGKPAAIGSVILLVASLAVVAYKGP